MNEDKLFKTIIMEVLSIEEELETLNEGIFFAPELYIGFRISKAIYRNREKLFQNCKIVDWKREENLGNGGPSDIIFKYIDGKREVNYLVIELKLRNTYGSYERDIKKLMQLKNTTKTKYHKYFCSLIDAFKEKPDGRLQKLKTEQNLKDNRHISFDTKNYSYKNEIYCHLTLTKVN